MTSKEEKQKDSSSIDLSLFKNDTKPSSSCKDFKSCISMNRLLLILQYNTLLKPLQNTENKEIFVKFMKEVYKQQIIDDIHHFTHRHGGQLQEIMEYSHQQYQFIHCELNQCAFASRHYRVSDNNNNNHSNDDRYFAFYQDIVDSFHYYLHHLFHAGFRIKIIDNDIDAQHVDDTKCDHDEYYDRDFAKRNKVMSNTRQSTQRFNRISSDSASKFKIQSDQEQTADIEQKTGDEITYLDRVYENLRQIKVNTHDIQRLLQFVSNEQYDTESVDIDLQINNGHGNIAKFINNKEIINAMMTQFNRARGIIFCAFLYIFHFFPCIFL